MRSVLLSAGMIYSAYFNKPGNLRRITMIPTRKIDESLSALFSVSHAFSEHLTKREDDQLRDKYDPAEAHCRKSTGGWGHPVSSCRPGRYPERDVRPDGISGG